MGKVGFLCNVDFYLNFLSVYKFIKLSCYKNFFEK